MAEQEIILKYKVDLSELDSAVGEMEQKMVAAKSAAQISPVDKDAAKNVKAVTAELLPLQAEIHRLELETNNLKKSLKETESELKRVSGAWTPEHFKMHLAATKLGEAIANNNKLLGGMKIEERALKKTIDGFSTMNRELRELKGQLASGQISGEAFDSAAEKAGELQEKLDGANQRVRALASSTKNLDATMQGIQGAAGIFSAYQGAAAAFGSENENLVKTLAKVQGSIALVNGLQSVAKTLNKDSAFSIIFLSKAQAAYAAIVGVTSGALKLMRVALIATGFGAIAVSIGVLIAKWDEWKVGIMAFIDLALLPFKTLLQAIGVIDDDETKAAIKRADQRIEKMGKEVLVLGRVKNAVQARYDAEIAFAQAAGKDTEKLERKKELDFIKRSQRELQILKNLNIARGGLTEDEAKLYQYLNDEILKARDRLEIAEIKNNKKIDARREEASKNRADNAKKEADKLLKNRVDNAKKEADKLLRQTEELEQLRLSMIADAEERELAMIRAQAEKKIAQAEGNAELMQALVDRRELDLQAVRDKFAKQREDKAREEFEKEVALIAEQDEVRISLIPDSAEREEAEIAASFDKRIQKLQDLGLLTTEVEAQIIQEQEDALKKLRKKRHEEEMEEMDQENKEKLAAQLKYVDARVKLAGDTLMVLQGFEKVLASAGEDTADFQKGLALFEIAISTAQAIANVILMSTAAAKAAAVMGNPLSPFLLAGYIATGLATVLGNMAAANNLVNSASVPKYAKGVEWLDGKGSATSDSIPAMLSKGERVVPTHLNEKYWDEYSAMHNGWFDKLVATKYIEPAIIELLSGTGVVTKNSWMGENIVGAISGNAKQNKKQHKELVKALTYKKDNPRRW